MPPIAYTARGYLSLLLLLAPLLLVWLVPAVPHAAEALVISAAGLAITGVVLCVVNIAQAGRARVTTGRAVLYGPLLVPLSYAVLFGIAAPWRDGCQGDDRGTAHAQMADIAKAADIYRVKTGRYPSTLHELIQPLEPLIIDRVPLDPWSRPYRYDRDGDRYRLCSAGPDAHAYTADDLCSD